MSVDSHNLARLVMVPASNAIGPEASAFTPWLAEHIGELGDAIGVGLALGEESVELAQLLQEHTEVPVGQFFLDIRAEAVDGRVAAIENQYGISDHKHLGQVLTYSAGVGADLVIWLAEEFTDPHLETLRWINKRTDDSFGVYAVRIRFVRIGDSPAAPDFEVVVAPSATARAERKVSAAQPHWTMPEFLDAIVNPVERGVVETLIRRLEETGDDTLWLGRKPGGQLNFHPRNLHEGPVSLWIKDGSVFVRGHWTQWRSTRNHPAYTPVADVLEQSVDGPAVSVALAGLDADELWTACLSAVDSLIAERNIEPNS